MKYVVGFYFDDLYERVLLIKKNRPDWQAGRLNGVGGKIEQGESPYEAMVREFQEETGVTEQHWQEVCTLNGTKSEVHVFVSNGNVTLARNLTDELLEIHDPNALPDEVLPNLRWLIPMSMEPHPPYQINEVHLLG